MKKPTPKYLLWVDLEMTGLDPETQRIIEVAAIITDWSLETLDSYHAVVRQNEEIMANMDEWCHVQHAKTGLTAEVPKGKPEAIVESELIELVKAYSEPILLAGNSIHFDRRFIRRYLPGLESLLHYRMLDVSAWKVVLEGRYGVKFRKPDTHRAMNDIEGSIEELRTYLDMAKFPAKKSK